MLLDTIATVVLLGMMLVPGFNIIVGTIAGAVLIGPLGALSGFLLGASIMLAQRRLYVAGVSKRWQWLPLQTAFRLRG